MLVGRLQEPASRRRQLLDLGLHVSAKPGVRGRELSGRGYPLNQPGVIQHCRVMDERGDGPALVLEYGRGAP